MPFAATRVMRIPSRRCCGNRDHVPAGRYGERTGERSRLEVVEGELVIDVDVDRGVWPGVQHGHLSGGGVSRRKGLRWQYRADRCNGARRQTDQQR